MIDLLKNYIEKRIQLIKLELIGVIANIAASIVNSFLALVFLLFILLMLSFSLAFWLSEIYESHKIGFAMVGVIYAALFVIYLIFFKNKIEIKVKDSIVKSSLTSEGNNETNNPEILNEK